MLPQEVYLNDVSIKLPYKHEGITIRNIHGYIQVHTSIGVGLVWNPASTFEVQISSKLRGQVSSNAEWVL